MRGMEKTGKVADARRAVASARAVVTRLTECVFDGSFDENVSKLNHARVDLARKEKRLRELEKKMY